MTRPHPKIFLAVIGACFFIVLLLLLAAGSLIVPRIAKITPDINQPLTLVSPLKITLNVPTARRALKPVINPPVEGSWSWEGGLPGGHLARTLVFTPEEIWEPNQKYSISLEGLSPVFSPTKQNTETANLQTKPLPTVVEVSVKEGETEHPADSPITLTLDQELGEIVDFTFRLEPEASILIATDPTRKQYIVMPAEPLRQGQEYRLTAEREIAYKSRASGTIVGRAGKATVFERVFKTKTPPYVTQFAPQGSAVLPTTDSISLTFSSPMKRDEIDSRLMLNPPLKGAWEWSSDQVLRFRLAEKLKLATKYSVVIGAGAHAQDGSYFDIEAVLSFSTVGALKVTGVTPSNRRAGVSVKSTMKLSFDQPISQTSVSERLSVTPAIDYDLQWTTSSVTLMPRTPLANNTTYSIRLKAGASGEYGLPSSEDFVSTFSTEEKVVLLNVAWDRQDRALSCEVAALKMAMSYKGIRVTEDQLMAKVGYDPTPRTSGGWGDPDSAFVGDINGSQNTTGYGVHWAPIARAASAWRPAKAVTGMTLQQAASEIEAGNPIVFWGVTGKAYYDPWVTPEGRKIEAWKGEHTRTIIGFKGSVENPTSFIINDPQSGRLTWSAATLKSNWSTFGYAAVIVY